MMSVLGMQSSSTAVAVTLAAVFVAGMFIVYRDMRRIEAAVDDLQARLQTAGWAASDEADTNGQCEGESVSEPTPAQKTEPFPEAVPEPLPEAVPDSDVAAERAVEEGSDGGQAVRLDTFLALEDPITEAPPPPVKRPRKRRAPPSVESESGGLELVTAPP